MYFVLFRYTHSKKEPMGSARFQRGSWHKIVTNLLEPHNPVREPPATGSI